MIFQQSQLISQFITYRHVITKITDYTLPQVHISKSYEGFGALLTFAYAMGMIGTLSILMNMLSRY